MNKTTGSNGYTIAVFNEQGDIHFYQESFLGGVKVFMDIRKADKKAEELNEKYGEPCTRVISLEGAHI